MAGRESLIQYPFGKYAPPSDAVVEARHPTKVAVNTKTSGVIIMTNQLIPVFDGTINNEPVLLCNARNLHAFLGIGKMFAHWIKDRLGEYGFVENQDVVMLAKIGKQKVEAVTTARNTTSPSTQPKSLRWLNVTKKAARYAATSSSAKRNFATFSQYKLSSNSQPKKSSSFATCSSGWKKPRTSANTCIPL